MPKNQFSSNSETSTQLSEKHELVRGEPAISHPIVLTQPDSGPRPIRSFALRAGHMSPAQKRAYVDGMPKWSVGYVAKVCDFDAYFPKSQPLVFEIGFGMGETSAHIAKTLPTTNFLGAEVYTSGVGSLLKLIEQDQLANQRVIQHDAVEVLTHMFAPNSLAGIHIFFPDPWHKARHFKRRLIQAEFVRLAASRIAPGGYLHCATDWENYAHQMLLVLGAESQLSNTATDFSERPDYRPVTKFENRGLKLGHGVWDLVFLKK